VLVQLSDPHIRLGEHAEAAAAALSRAVAAVNALDPGPDAVIVTGDLANGGSPEEEYARVKELLAPLDAPVHVLAGNHDDVPELEAALGPAEFAVRVGGLRLVGANTNVPGEDGGKLDLRRLAARLNEDTETPTIVAMHHPPILTGIPAMDRIGLPDLDRHALAELLKVNPQVKRVIAGHVHRAITGAVGDVPVFTCPGTHWQLALDFHAEQVVTTEDDPPGFALHVLLDGDVTSHVVYL
jgi:3',5'-cyclic AMP phosphodiesterase CpdA